MLSGIHLTPDSPLPSTVGQAAQVIAASPGALQLRQLQSMVEISAENSSTVIFPIPVQLLEALESRRSV